MYPIKIYQIPEYIVLEMEESLLNNSMHCTNITVTKRNATITHMWMIKLVASLESRCRGSQNKKNPIKWKPKDNRVIGIQRMKIR